MVKLFLNMLMDNAQLSKTFVLIETKQQRSFGRIKNIEENLLTLMTDDDITETIEINEIFLVDFETPCKEAHIVRGLIEKYRVELQKCKCKYYEKDDIEKFLSYIKDKLPKDELIIVLCDNVGEASFELGSIVFSACNITVIYSEMCKPDDDFINIMIVNNELIDAIQILE